MSFGLATGAKQGFPKREALTVQETGAGTLGSQHSLLLSRVEEWHIVSLFT